MKTQKKTSMKQFDLTPGDSRDYLGIRVRVESVDERKKGSEQYKPVVSLSLTSLEELITEGPDQPSAEPDSE